jgi:hypothetical protein
MVAEGSKIPYVFVSPLIDLDCLNIMIPLLSFASCIADLLSSNTTTATSSIQPH